MKKQDVIIDVWETEDHYEIVRVYLAYKPTGEHIPPDNTQSGGFFLYGIEDYYFEEWNVIDDYRCES
tara:strand:+ start:912 stop:1112 length:201 start_codon:yes stop_codon:yes gene_type:complete